MKIIRGHALESDAGIEVFVLILDKLGIVSISFDCKMSGHPERDGYVPFTQQGEVHYVTYDAKRKTTKVYFWCTNEVFKSFLNLIDSKNIVVVGNIWGGWKRHSPDMEWYVILKA